MLRGRVSHVILLPKHILEILLHVIIEIALMTTCSIFFEEYEDGDVLRVLPGCGHRYHIECLDKWALAATDFSRPPACPLCNKEI